MTNIEWSQPIERLYVTTNTKPRYSIVKDKETQKFQVVVSRAGYGVVIGNCKTLDKAKALVAEEYEAVLEIRRTYADPDDLRTPARQHVLPDRAVSTSH